MGSSAGCRGLPVVHAPDTVRLRCVLEPQPAYRWRLALEVEYRLSDTGLTVEATATNLAGTRAPFGIGFHPYLTVGTATIDDAVLSLPARRCLLADERGLPVGEVAVAGTADDFATAASDRRHRARHRVHRPRRRRRPASPRGPRRPVGRDGV